MTALLAAFLSPFFVDFTPEVRTTYQSLGKLVEDRPMQVTSVKAGIDTGLFGRLGVRNWDVSSLTDRRADIHRHCLYHTEFGPIWQYDWAIAEEWKLKSELTRSWTIYDGFESSSANKTYHWWQIDQSLANPYVTPFYRLRRTFRTTDYFYFKIGANRHFTLWRELYATPSVYVEGGNGRNLKRVFGPNPCGDSWGAGGVGSVSFRLELGWRFSDWAGVFAYVEQYEVTGHDARKAVSRSHEPCAHNDWTHAGCGLRLTF